MPVSYGMPKGSKFYLFNSIFGFSQNFSLNMNSFRKLYLIICKSLLFDPSSNDRLLIHNLCTFDVFPHFKIIYMYHYGKKQIIHMGRFHVKIIVDLVFICCGNFTGMQLNAALWTFLRSAK